MIEGQQCANSGNFAKGATMISITKMLIQLFHLMPLAKKLKKVANKDYSQARETSFVWQHPILKEKDLLIKVTHWMMVACGDGELRMTFKGLAQISSDVILYINGYVVPLAPKDYRKRLWERPGWPLDWKTFPDALEGYIEPIYIQCFEGLYRHVGSRYVGSIELTLFSHPSQIDWLYRAFNYGTDNPNDCPPDKIEKLYRTFDSGTDTNKNGVLIATKIFYPDKDEMGDEFWKDSWRSKYLAVGSWHAVWGQPNTR